MSDASLPIDFWTALDRLVVEHPLVIDRPGGTPHPRYPDMIYPLDYGYLDGTSAADGGGIDVWAGSAIPQKVDAIVCIVDLVKRDSEIKILLGCTSAEQQIILDFQNNSSAMKAILIPRP